MALFIVVALLLRQGDTGVHFRTSDQVSMVIIGFLFSVGILLFTTPRVRADADGIEVRNVLNSKRFAWTQVQSVGFPDGAPWARLEFEHDEYHPMLAIQATDGMHAVQSIRELRALHKLATEK
ncbi:PH domain-containing protein [Pseudonocardiaceae bacterium YIM PH 21723]|nr:PH domain-containing protein [Pseudonocardiaceae bacterium YIM PH 21723]